MAPRTLSPHATAAPARRQVLAVVPMRGAPAAERFAPLVARALRCRRCSVMLPSEDGALVLEEAIGLPPGLERGARLPRGAGVAGRVAAARQPALVNDHCERADWPSSLGTYPSDAFISFPFELPDGTVGVVSATEREGEHRFGAADLAVLADLTAFYASTFDSAARREVRRLRGELSRARGAFIQAQEAERQRLARELHDDAGHTLTAAILRLDMAAAGLIGQGDFPRTIEAIRGALVECAEHLHDLAFQLQPRLLTDLGLVAALRSLTRRVRDMAAVAIDLTVVGAERRLAAEVELATFRIAQEAVTNALKHAGAGHIGLTLGFDAESLVIAIADDGRGLRPGPAGGDPRGRHGLQGMRERAELVGGELRITSQPGAGTIVRGRLPAIAAPVTPA